MLFNILQIWDSERFQLPNKETGFVTNEKYLNTDFTPLWGEGWPIIGIEGFAIILHTQLRKQAFTPHSHIQIWYLRALGTARSQKSSCQYTAGRLHSYLLHLLGTRCFLPFPLTFPAISSATEIGPPNSSLHLTESFTGSQIYVEVVRICWWMVKPTTTEKGWRLIGSCEEC